MSQRSRKRAGSKQLGPSVSGAAALHALIQSDYDRQRIVPAAGVLLLSHHGWGELRRPQFDYAARPDDVLVPADLLEVERTEDATDWKRGGLGEVISSTSDGMAESHVAVAELVL